MKKNRIVRNELLGLRKHVNTPLDERACYASPVFNQTRCVATSRSESNNQDASRKNWRPIATHCGCNLLTAAPQKNNSVNKKAEISLHFLILGVIGIFILGIIFLNPHVMSLIAEKLPNILPWYNNTKQPIQLPEIIRYSIVENKVEYYDGLSWFPLPSEKTEDWSQKVKVGKKEITHNQARYNFARYYFDNSLRNKDLQIIELQDPLIYGLITGILQVDDKTVRGNTLIYLRQKNVAGQYLGKIFRVGDETDTKNNGIFLRYEGNNWQWADSGTVSFPTGLETWVPVSINPVGRISTYQKEIIENLVEKNFESGKEVLLQKIETLPYEKFIFVSENSLGERLDPNNPPLEEKIYLRYNKKWEWSVDNQNWIDVDDKRINYPLKQITGPFIEYTGQALIMYLRNKNLDEGKNEILSSKTHADKNSIKVLKGLYTLNLQNTVSFQEEDDVGLFIQATPESQSKLNILTPIIKEKAIAWRDSVLQKQMCFCYTSTTDCALLDVEKLSANSQIYLVTDLNKPQGTCSQQ